MSAFPSLKCMTRRESWQLVDVSELNLPFESKRQVCLRKARMLLSYHAGSDPHGHTVHTSKAKNSVCKQHFSSPLMTVSATGLEPLLHYNFASSFMAALDEIYKRSWIPMQGHRHHWILQDSCLFIHAGVCIQTKIPTQNASLYLSFSGSFLLNVLYCIEQLTHKTPMRYMRKILCL